eukprot:gene13279-9120_t
MAERRPASRFSSERRAAFGKKVREEFLLQGRDQKDQERARMEAYRKLCEAEGIHSKRLEEYDEAKRKATEELSKRLEEIDYDQSLTNNEKKRKKFNLKRKFAATTVGEVMEKGKKKFSAITAAEKIGKKRQAEKEERLAAKKQREEDKRTCIKARKERNHLYAQRTRKGQPILSTRVEKGHKGAIGRMIILHFDVGEAEKCTLQKQEGTCCGAAELLFLNRMKFLLFGYLLGLCFTAKWGKAYYHTAVLKDDHLGKSDLPLSQCGSCAARATKPANHNSHSCKVVQQK